LSWLLLEEHHNFIPAWQLIHGIAKVNDIELTRAAHLLVRLNKQDPVDGCYPAPFYGYRKFDGYFLASDTEINLCIEALRKAILCNIVSVFDDGKIIDLSLEHGFEAQKGMDFFFRKQDVLKAINDKSIELGEVIPIPDCLLGAPKAPPSARQPSNKTKNSQAQFIKGLLTVMYGEDVAASPRRHIDGKRSQIRNDLEIKNLPCPSGVTVEKWLSEAD